MLNLEPWNPGTDTLSGVLTDQHQRISNHADTAQEHGGYGHQRSQQAAHGQGDTNDIVRKCEGQIMANFFIL